MKKKIFFQDVFKDNKLKKTETLAFLSDFVLNSFWLFAGQIAMSRWTTKQDYKKAVINCCYKACLRSKRITFSLTNYADKQKGEESAFQFWDESRHRPHRHCGLDLLICWRPLKKGKCFLKVLEARHKHPLKHKCILLWMFWSQTLIFYTSNLEKRNRQNQGNTKIEKWKQWSYECIFPDVDFICSQKYAMCPLPPAHPLPCTYQIRLLLLLALCIIIRLFVMIIRHVVIICVIMHD